MCHLLMQGLAVMMLVSCYRCMKMKEEHIVPLSRQAMILLAQLKQISGDR